MSAISLQGRSVLALADFSAEEIERILQVAAQMKKIVLSDNKKRDFLKGKSMVTVFSEASTRTRSSFELAGKYLGADVINITKSGSSMTKGESMRDTLLTVSAMGVDAVIIRDSSEGAALFASKVMSPKVKVPVVLNAGDGAHAHPSQALLELFTLKEAGKNIKGMKYVIIGDILHSRVARSDIVGFTKLGAEVHLVGPRTLVPKELEAIISEEGLKAQETVAYINKCFREGEIKETGTEITKILPPIPLFTAQRDSQEKKASVIRRLKAFFDRFFDISLQEM